MKRRRKVLSVGAPINRAASMARCETRARSPRIESGTLFGPNPPDSQLRMPIDRGPVHAPPASVSSPLPTPS